MQHIVSLFYIKIIPKNTLKAYQLKLINDYKKIKWNKYFSSFFLLLLLLLFNYIICILLLKLLELTEKNEIWTKTKPYLIH